MAYDKVGLFKTLLVEAGDQIPYLWMKKQFAVLHSLWFESSMLGDVKFFIWWNDLVARLKYEADVEVPKSETGDFYRLIPSADPECLEVMLHGREPGLALTEGCRQIVVQLDEALDTRIEAVFPDEIQLGTSLLCLQGKGGPLKLISDQLMGDNAKGLRLVASAWRDCLSSLPNYPPDAVEQLASHGLVVKPETILDWRRGRVAIAPSVVSIKGLHDFAAATPWGFDLSACLEANERVRVAQEAAMRLLRKSISVWQGENIGSRVQLSMAGALFVGDILKVVRLRPGVFPPPAMIDVF
jgi:hypothetical protein